MAGSLLNRSRIRTFFDYKQQHHTMAMGNLLDNVGLEVRIESRGGGKNFILITNNGGQVEETRT